jgi:hypothetical protein
MRPCSAASSGRKTAVLLLWQVREKGGAAEDGEGFFGSCRCRSAESGACEGTAFPAAAREDTSAAFARPDESTARRLQAPLRLRRRGPVQRAARHPMLRLRAAWTAARAAAQRTTRRAARARSRIERCGRAGWRGDASAMAGRDPRAFFFVFCFCRAGFSEHARPSRRPAGLTRASCVCRCLCMTATGTRGGAGGRVRLPGGQYCRGPAGQFLCCAAIVEPCDPVRS